MRPGALSSLLALLCVAGSAAFVVRPASSTAGRTLSDNVAPLQVFDNIFAKTTSKSSTSDTPQYEPVVIEPDFRVAGAFLALGGLLDTIPYIQLFLGLPVTALGILFLVQTFRIRFIFDADNNLELVMGDGSSTGENVVVGGANKWACDTIVNYDFFPAGWIDSNPIGPILVYFKETQTDKSKWNEGPGASANEESKIAAGQAVAGQVHFFPAVCNAQQIRAEFEKRQCGKIDV